MEARISESGWDFAQIKVARTHNTQLIQHMARTDGVAKLQSSYVLSADAEIIRRVWELAGHYGVSTSVIAQAWNLAKPVVTSPLIGASKTKYIDDAIAAIDLRLTPEEMAYLEEPYVPHAQYGFR